VLVVSCMSQGFDDGLLGLYISFGATLFIEFPQDGFVWLPDIVSVLCLEWDLNS